MSRPDAQLSGLDFSELPRLANRLWFDSYALVGDPKALERLRISLNRLKDVLDEIRIRGLQTEIDLRQ